ncbi:hypothetical protein ACQW5G_05850 [Fructilactobacillus sp. Tb1]|uniref:hypothetical protein n=1 Tax=Fructilactobacillus sp. Tb1 TaxID=3422304 RepID=UPI003D28B67F
MKCHYDRKLTKKNFANFAKKLDEHHAAVVNAVFDKNPLVNKMIHGYDSMKQINREIVDEYAEASKQDLTKTLVDTYNENPDFDYTKGNLK